MASTANRWRRRLVLGAAIAVGPVGSAWAQAVAVNGVLGEYYDGANFERLVTRRYDATLAFDWGHAPPVPGVPAEYFSVRWTGWLVPPVSGRYVLHVTVDDGMRIWLNDKLVLDEWRPQPVRQFTAAINLKAGEPYKLRVDYFQDILDTRARVTWERPDVPLASSPPASWRNLWGLMAETPTPEPIPTEFLFRANPRPGRLALAPPKPVAAVVRPAVRVPVVAAVPPPAAPPAAVRRRRAPAAPTVLTLVPVSPATPLPRPAAAPQALADTVQLARLAVGESLTLPDLFFTQGQASLLPGTRAALSKVAATLSTRPGLRFEVQGHTDNVGNAELNRQLSQRRAEAVCLYLMAHGVGTAQLRPVGYGGSQPVADNVDPAQRPRNRRVVLRRL